MKTLKLFFLFTFLLAVSGIAQAQNHIALPCENGVSGPNCPLDTHFDLNNSIRQDVDCSPETVQNGVSICWEDRCLDPRFKSCSFFRDQNPEICGDGIDNNLNGTIDEGCSQQDCQEGDENCVPADEICGDNIDNNGDGNVDEGCVNAQSSTGLGGGNGLTGGACNLVKNSSSTSLGFILIGLVALLGLVTLRFRVKSH